jgi:carboxyl-terminal processing protease
LAASLGDPYTTFFPPKQNKSFQSDISGNFEGVGMEVGVKDNQLTVVAPLKGTPAYNAGIKAGDKILKIDDKPSSGMSADEAVTLIRGKEGTKVAVTLSRKDVKEPIVVTLTREVINIPTIDTEQKPNGIYLIRLYNFSAISPEMFREALKKFAESGSDKLILDLRGNPGGYLDAAIDMASWFLPPGEVIVKEDFGLGKEQGVHRSIGHQAFNNNLKMVILIDQGSASASEILAGALSEHGVAKLVGTKSFGKGSVQELVPITPDTSLKVTIARWLTPNGISISAGGLTPDVEVKMTEKDFTAGKDPQMDKAIEILKAE